LHHDNNHRYSQMKSAIAFWLFFVRAKPPRAGAEAVPEDPLATPTANTNFTYIKHATQL
jgi:hypothetical protein